MSKKIYAISAAVLVVLAAGGALGYWLNSQSRYYKLVQREEAAARVAFDSYEATDVSAEEMTVSLNTATDAKATPSDSAKALTDAKASFGNAESHLNGDLPQTVNKWKSEVDASNNTLKKLWLTKSQRTTLAGMNTQYLRLIKQSNNNISDTNSLEPAMQETIKFMQAALALGQFSSKYQSQDQMAAHISEISQYSSYAAPGYAYDGEPGVKAKYPTIEAAVVAADKTVGDTYLLYKDVADNNIGAALSLAPQVQNESARLSASGDAIDALAKSTGTPRDKEIISAASSFSQIVTSSSDQKLRHEVGLRKYQTAAITSALDLYGYDHRNSDKNVTFPAGGSLSSVITTLKTGKYLASDPADVNAFSYKAADNNQAFTLEYTDDLTGKNEKTAGA